MLVTHYSQKKKSTGPVGIAILCILVLLATIKVLVFPHATVLRAHAIGVSMEPTIHYGEWLVEENYSYELHEPHRGDIVMFIAPPQPNEYYLKRIIAIPGDRIVVNNTTVSINDVQLNEPYVSPEWQGNPYKNKYINTVVPAGNYFVMGDDRMLSYDSRAWGFVPRANILFRVLLILPYTDNSGFIG